MKNHGPAEKVLLYHAVSEDRDFPASTGTNVTPAEFARQVLFLSRNYSAVRLGSGETPAGPTGKPPLALTFDDGYRDNFETAYPVLARSGIPVTFFLTVSRVGTDWAFPRGEYPGLTWEQVREMDRNPLVDFGSHGHTHRILTGMPEEEAAAEIERSKAVLEERLARPIDYFSYPHGSYNRRVKELVRKAGYRAAYSVISGGEDDFSRRRILVSRRDSLFRLRLKLSPLYWPLRRII